MGVISSKMREREKRKLKRLKWGCLVEKGITLSHLKIRVTGLDKQGQAKGSFNYEL